MGLPFLANFKKEVAKLDTVGVGIKTTESWLSTGNYALNRALSGDFKKGIPLSKLTLFAGPSGSGKSFISANLCRQAQLEGYHILYIDSEHAIDVDYLAKIGVNVSEEALTYISVATIEDVNAILSEFFSGYKKEYGKDNMEAQKTLIVLDSLAMLSSSTEMENYDKGVVKGDQGQLAKRRKAMLRLAVGNIGRLPVSMVLTDHVYPQDIMMGDGAWAITNSTKFSVSIIGIVTKLKLKEEGEVTGVRMRFETYKSRFAKLGTKVELEVPYNKGMSPFSGLLELLEADGVIAKGTQPGEKMSYVCTITDKDGVILDRIVFKEKELTNEIALRLLEHPACQPMLARKEAEPTEEELEAVLNDDEVEVDVDAAPAAKKRGKK
jgi:recombination protein RecA